MPKLVRADNNPQIGVDASSSYTYYKVVGFDQCIGCKHFSDNEMEERFECDIAICKYEEIDWNI